MTTRQDRIRREMKRRRITQGDLAEALDASPRTIGRVLNGERDIPETLWLIEDHLGLPHTDPEAEDEPDLERDVQDWPDGLLFARLHELTAEAQRRLSEARSAPPTFERPPAGSRGNVPRGLRRTKDTRGRHGGSNIPNA